MNTSDYQRFVLTDGSTVDVPMIDPDGAALEWRGQCGLGELKMREAEQHEKQAGLGETIICTGERGDETARMVKMLYDAQAELPQNSDALWEEFSDCEFADDFEAAVDEIRRKATEIRIFLCANDEVLRQDAIDFSSLDESRDETYEIECLLGLHDGDPSLAEAWHRGALNVAMDVDGAVIHSESQFRAYRGGPRRGVVDVAGEGVAKEQVMKMEAEIEAAGTTAVNEAALAHLRGTLQSAEADPEDWKPETVALIRRAVAKLEM